MKVCTESFNVVNFDGLSLLNTTKSKSYLLAEQEKMGENQPTFFKLKNFLLCQTKLQCEY